MSRKDRSQIRFPRAVHGGTLLGVFVGVILGLAIAAALAYYLNRSGLTAPLPAAGGAKESTRSGKAESGVGSTTPDKPRFDFYKILPGGEERKRLVHVETLAGCPSGAVAKTTAFERL